VRNLNIDLVKKVQIPFPPLHEQTNIVTLLDGLSTETMKLENIYQQKLVDLEELKKSILQKAFNGELNTGQP
jgi:type I restriction enzyme S subunit